MRTRRGRVVATVVTVSVLLPTLVTTAVDAASATTLGGLDAAALTASTHTGGTGAPTVVSWENFNGATNATIPGTTTDGGSDIWVANPASGVWRINANRARSTTANASLVIDPGVPDLTVVGTVARNGATTFDAGMTLHRNALGTQFLTCEWTSTSNGSMEIWKFDTAWALLGSVTNLYPGGIATAPTSIVMACGATATAVTASINGVPVVSATLSAAEQTVFKNVAHPFAGLFQYTSNGVTWDDVHVDVP